MSFAQMHNDYLDPDLHLHQGEEPEPKTDVIFRTFISGDVIALFPAEPGTNNWRKDCQSYQKIGQHGSASVGLACIARASTEEEIAPLRKELERLGYSLREVKRFHRGHTKARRAAVEAVRAKP